MILSGFPLGAAATQIKGTQFEFIFDPLTVTLFELELAK